MKYSFIILSLLITRSAVADIELRDPTKPSYLENNSSVSKTVTPEAPTTESTQTWTLETTLADSKRIIAIINGQQVRVGDEVDGAYVLKITHQQVTLKHNDKLFDLQLHKSFTSFMK